MAKISKDQEEIINFLEKEYLTIKQIAKRRQTTIQAVYKIVRKLKKKGLLSRGFKTGGLKWGGYYNHEKNEGVGIMPKSETHFLRLHNIQESLKIIQAGEKYNQARADNNKFELDGFTILLYEDNIQIYTTQALSFYGLSTDECYLLALEEFSKLYNKLENRLNIIINKDGKLNHNWVRLHIAETNNELAQEQNNNKEQIRAKAKEDNKTWLITDNSFKLNELEFTHPQTAKLDTEKIINHFQAIRNFNCLDPHELTENSRIMTIAIKNLLELLQNIYK
jgi:Fe2+ or Zn2+ uptake regulation protein